MAIIRLLRIGECPSWGDALVSLELALGELGASKSAEVVVVESLEDAAGMDFGGSPTITLDGQDIFGSQGATGLTCRLYVTDEGLRGSPTPQMVLAALRAAGFPL